MDGQYNHLIHLNDDILSFSGHALHIEELVKAIGKEPTRDNRVSLSGSLNSYVKKCQIFTKPAPNTFGLLEGNTGTTEFIHDPVE